MHFAMKKCRLLVVASKLPLLLLELDLTERSVLLGESCKCSEEHATVADRAAGLAEAKSGKLHESASMKSFKSNGSSSNGGEKSNGHA